MDGHCIDDLAKDTLDVAKRKVNLFKLNRTAKEKGLQYIRKDGTVVPTRSVKPPCKCNMECFSKYTEAVRKEILTNFLRLKSSGQNQFLATHMFVKQTARIRVVNSRRTYSRVYKLPSHNGTTTVCKVMFMDTFDIKDRKLRCLADKIIQGNGVARDDGRANNTSPKEVKRGHH
ncbi:uncharacterized protein LOC131679247 [Topomyia yanbarensis]|uniref:uncharacterized protein LOC131679247 n=1 Tax=Topomyia yanbarensis TaxID=2498891 RepID=UPI00273B366D|nr:uncharacterized protein LOC131679247 [Topomyia yanbarensis]